MLTVAWSTYFNLKKIAEIIDQKASQSIKYWLLQWVTEPVNNECGNIIMD